MVKIQKILFNADLILSCVSIRGERDFFFTYIGVRVVIFIHIHSVLKTIKLLIENQIFIVWMEEKDWTSWFFSGISKTTNLKKVDLNIEFPLRRRHKLDVIMAPHNDVICVNRRVGKSRLLHSFFRAFPQLPEHKVDRSSTLSFFSSWMKNSRD